MYAAPCRQITDEFRKSYALLWQSLIFADAEGIKQHSQAMNAGDMYPLFAGMLTNRPWDEVPCQCLLSCQHIRPASIHCEHNAQMHRDAELMGCQRRHKKPWAVNACSNA